MSVDPGEGFRLLLKGEPIREDVSYYVKGKWHKMSTDSNVGEPWNDVDFFPMRVPKEIADNTGIEVHTGGPYVPIEVHRAALKEIDRLQWELRDSKVWWKEEIERLKAELSTHRDIWTLARDIAAKERDAAEQEVKRLKAELDAVKHSRPSPEPEWFDLTPFGEHVLRPCVDHSLCSGESDYWYTGIKWPEGATISKAKTWPSGWCRFRCLLKDAPPELVAKASGLTKAKEIVESLPEGQRNVLVASAMASTPAEDPDEWVTQDRVPVRPGIDKVNWHEDDVSSAIEPFDASIGKMHGCKNWLGNTLHVWCRRRDLPPMPEAKQVETVREVLLYWYDGNVVGRYADCPLTDPSFVPLIIRDGKVFVETETREVVR